MKPHCETEAEEKGRNRKCQCFTVARFSRTRRECSLFFRLFVVFVVVASILYQSMISCGLRKNIYVRTTQRKFIEETLPKSRGKRGNRDIWGKFKIILRVYQKKILNNTLAVK